jgi:menaquinone-specific isochorismate synthase
VITKDGKFTMVTFAVCLDNFSTASALHEFLQNQLKKLTTTVDQKLSPGSEQTTNRTSTSQVSLPSKHAEYSKWLTSVNKAKQLIHSNKFEKIVLARSITLSRNKNVTVTQVINNLRKRYINCYNFLIHQPAGDTFLGSTPERLAMARNNLLLTEALAGSIERGQTATEDSILEKKLSDNGKDRSEHQFVIKDIEERLKSSVKKLVHEKTPQVKKLSNVQHLYTPMRAQLKDDSKTLEVIGKLHPTPAVGGYPWDDAAPYIKELEHFERGWYAGPVGWISGTNNMEFAVAIRSGLFTNDTINLFAGCGIVNDSDPDTEWKETNLKLKPMLSALQYD